MLADRVIHAEAHHMRRMIGEAAVCRLRQDVGLTEKFMLDSHMAQAADALTRREIEQGLKWVRQPYQSVWIECAQTDRPSFRKNAVGGVWDAPIQRIGLLVQSDGSKSLAHLFWQFLDGTFNCSSMAVAWDLSDVDAFGSDKPWRFDDLGINNIIKMVPSPYFTVCREAMKGRADLAARMSDQAHSDWGGEIGYWWAVALLFNCRNFTARQVVSHQEDNARRKRLGRPALSSYTRVTVRVPGVLKRTIARSSATGAAPPLRAHFVMGHLKIRKTGVFWWNPYMRGNLSRGFAKKEYLIQHDPIMAGVA